MSLESLHDLNLEEFQELMAMLFDAAEGCNMGEAFRPVLTAYFLSLKDEEEQLRCVRTCCSCSSLLSHNSQLAVFLGILNQSRRVQGRPC